MNKISEIMTRAASKNVDPPLLAPAEGLVLPLRLDPSGINFYNPDLGEPKFWQNGFQPNYLPQYGNVLRVQIDRAQSLDPNFDRNREKIEELGRDEVVEYLAMTPTGGITLAQKEYGSIAWLISMH